VKQEIQQHARDKGSLVNKKCSMSVYSMPYFKDGSGLVSQSVCHTAAAAAVSSRLYVCHLCLVCHVTVLVDV